MRYFLMCCAEDETLATLSSSRRQVLQDELSTYEAALLEPAEMAMTVRVRNGRVSVTDGSVIPPPERIREVVLIDARDLNEAIQVASRLPWARLGSVEVRPVASRGRFDMTTSSREHPMGPEYPTVVSRAEWLAARKVLLTNEKALTRSRDAVNAARRRLPMVAIDKDYRFDGPDGAVRLIDLFARRRQLIVYHFMFDPNWDEGCPSCSFLTDNIGHLSHLHARNTSLVLISRAPLAKILPFKRRMGWTVPWYSSFGSDFNYDFHVTMDEAVAPVQYNYRDQAELKRNGEEYFTHGESHGLSVFLRAGDRVFHTYSTYARGTDLLAGTYNYLDLTPWGRQEDWEEPAGRSTGPFMSWLRHHDRYAEDAQRPAACCHTPAGGRQG
jgi:predicted dithiol-disulfide oxidoreductase (DUF899 family)